MTHIKLRNTLTEDDRWLDAGPTAFTVYVAACCYSDLHLTDGAIPAARVRRVALTLAVHPDGADAAAERLVELGFWTVTEDGYQIVDYLKEGIGFSREETERVRDVWAADKRWRRRHRNGNHDICPPEKCPAGARMAAGTAGDSQTPSRQDAPEVQQGQAGSPARTTPVSQRYDTTRPDTTRHDPKGRGRGVEGEDGSASSDGSAPLAASSPPPPPDHDAPWLGDLPFGPPPGITPTVVVSDGRTGKELR